MSAIDTNVKILRPTIAARFVFGGIYLIAIPMLNIGLPFNIPDHYKLLVMSVFVVGGAFGVVDVFLKRIVLQADSITIVSLTDFISRTIPRSEIESVTWEKGCGASLKFRSGKGIRLPNVGLNAQGLTNTIRAWLKRTEGVK